GQHRARPAGRRGREGVRPPLVVRTERAAAHSGRRRGGTPLLGLRREPVPRLRIAARQRLDRPPASQDRRCDQGAGREALHDRTTYRCPAGHPDPCPVCTGAPHLEEILQYEGAHTVAAVILETVTGTNGIIVPPDGYLQAIREVCDRHGIVLICDEVMAGFGRTGRWFGVDIWDF